MTSAVQTLSGSRTCAGGRIASSDQGLSRASTGGAGVGAGGPSDAVGRRGGRGLRRDRLDSNVTSPSLSFPS